MSQRTRSAFRNFIAGSISTLDHSYLCFICCVNYRITVACHRWAGVEAKLFFFPHDKTIDAQKTNSFRVIKAAILKLLTYSIFILFQPYLLDMLPISPGIYIFYFLLMIPLFLYLKNFGGQILWKLHTNLCKFMQFHKDYYGYFWGMMHFLKAY